MTRADTFADRYFVEMKQLQWRIDQTKLTDAQSQDWWDVLESHEYFDGETEIQFAYFEKFCEDRGIKVAS